VNFDAGESFDLDGDRPLSFEWDFGDGTINSEQLTAHIFASPGEFVVLLTVTDAQGLASSTSMVVRVLEGPLTPSVPGDLVITEIMKTPSSNGQFVGEYFEIYNPTATPFTLGGCTISDLGTDFHQIPTDVVIEPDTFAILAVSGVAVAEPDYVYRSAAAPLNFFLEESNDEIIIKCNDITIDEVVYVVGDDDDLFPMAQGTSMNLDPGALNSISNDDGSNWCETPKITANLFPVGPGASTGDFGTPGAGNIVCAGND
jgi:hypothetical protein